VIRSADLALVPARPSPHDLRSIGRTIELVEAAEKPMIFVVNGGTKRARMTGQAAIVLSQHGTVAPAVLHQRVDFASSMISGLTAGEVDPGSPSAQEIAQLWEYVNTRLISVKLEPALYERLKMLGVRRRQSNQAIMVAALKAHLEGEGA